MDEFKELRDEYNMETLNKAIDQSTTTRVINFSTNFFRTFSQFTAPAHIYVPQLITIAAKFLRDSVTPLTGPYHLLYLNLHDILFWQTFLVILLHPVLWNCIARFEYHTRFISRAFVKPKNGVIALAIWIILVGLYRDILFNMVTERQDKVAELSTLPFRALGVVSIALGLVLVVMSFIRLGFFGTYLGDYFGILMEEKVTGFPFDIFTHPMYDGSTLIFLGKALLYVISSTLFFVHCGVFAFQF